MNNNVFKAQVKTDNISCPICYNILKDPVECLICHHNFCKECYDKRIKYMKDNNLEIKCSFCNSNKNGNWIIKENQLMRSLIKYNLYKCKNCKRIFDNLEELNNHDCKKIKCKYCKLVFDYDNFINHIELKHFYSLIDKFKKINNNINSELNNDVSLAPNGLYYCGKQTNLNCGCCSGICSEKNCLCVNCMNYNKKIKKLRDDFLINKAAKAAKYKKIYKTYYCNTFFTEEKKCNYPNICKECQILTKLMDKYLSKEVYESLIN
jgi:hypothetical protein